ncbi:MAG: tetratricopeptide repeat protein [Pirellulaceae bacterium]
MSVRRFVAVCRPWFLAVAAALVLAVGSTSWSQEQEGGFDEKQTVADIYNQTKAAKSAEQFGDIISQIEKAREQQLTEASAKYLQTLLAWAYNRRGEVLVDQMAEAETEPSAAKLAAEALSDFEASLKLDQQHGKRFVNRGVSYAQMGRLEDAAADMSTALRLTPDDANAWFNRGEIFYQLGDYDKAIADYLQVLRLSPNDFGAVTSLGHAYFVQKDYPRALLYYDRAVRLQPRNAEALANRGDAYHRRGQWDRAADDYLAAIAIDDQLGRAYQSGAWLMATCPLEAFRNPERAVAAAERAIELDGDGNYQYLDTLAAAQARVGDFEKAKQAIAQAIKKAPESEQEVLTKRQALYAEGKPYEQFSLKPSN